MAILNATGLSQSFGAFTVFSGVSVSIPNDGKIGLVGPNGIGKTTLLLVLAGETAAETGVVHRARSRRIGYLPQQADEAFAGRTHTVYEEMLSVFDSLRAQEARLRRLEANLAGASPEKLEQYSRAQDAFERGGGYEYEQNIRRILTGLGLGDGKWELPLPHLSGGQKTRVLLARLLLDRPDLLVLDEPTNHLDVQAVEWLEGMLKTWGGAVLLVSHDRYFLDSVADTIWEMNRTGIEVYRGNYSAYVRQREARWTRREQEFAALQARLNKEMDYIRRNMAGQRTQMAQGKLSRLGRELEAMRVAGYDAVRDMSWARISDAFNLGNTSLSVAEAAERIKALPRPTAGQLRLKLKLKPAFRSGNVVLRTYDLQVGYPGTPLFSADDIELRRKECAALIGANGTGKSTFLRAIMGDLQPLAGEIEPGASLQIGYFAQAHDALDLDNTVLDELLRHEHMRLSQARSYLAQFLFRGDDVFQPVRTLSGGERGRLALAILALSEANFLLLDEPTNHLDIPAQEVLQAVLENFEGTVLLVSHDRYLIDRLATQIWELADGQLRVFKGNYQALLAARAAAAVAVAIAAPDPTEPVSRPDEPAGQLSKNEKRRRAEAEAAIMGAIEQQEMETNASAEALQAASAAQDFDKIQRLSIEYETAQQRLDELVAEWEKLASE